MSDQPTDGRAAFERRAAQIMAKKFNPNVVLIGHSDSMGPRELVAPEDCDHHAGWCIDDDPESSGCNGCGMTRNRADCGEDDDDTALLDRLDVTIRDHPMAGSARQWRLIAADLILELTNVWGPSDADVDDMLARVRFRHDQRTIISRSGS